MGQVRNTKRKVGPDLGVIPIKSDDIWSHGHQKPKVQFKTEKEAGIARKKWWPVITFGEDAIKNRKTSEEVFSNWMTKDFLGKEMYRRFSAAPPIAITGGGVTGGKYLDGTNSFVMAEDFSGEVQRKLCAAHEQLHYAAWLGGGFSNTRWVGEDGALVSKKVMIDLHEGLTELFAQKLVRDHEKIPPLYIVGYPQETMMAFYLLKLVGEKTLKQAYFSGDFTQVKTVLDKGLGSGSFEKIINFVEEEKTTQALETLRERLAEHFPKKLEKWNQDPLIIDIQINALLVLFVDEWINVDLNTGKKIPAAKQLFDKKLGSGAYAQASSLEGNELLSFLLGRIKERGLITPEFNEHPIIVDLMED